jgi:membrane protease YdiL (CAAX protease family)
MMLAYTVMPAVAIYREGNAGGATWLDLGVIIFLWLPLEFGVGAKFLPRGAQGSIHTAAYGVAILLALTLFLLFREFKGMKYQLPRRTMDFLNPLIGYLLAGPVLIALGLWLGFLRPFHGSGRLSAGHIALTYLLILVATALPEEILFRSLLQNWITQRFGTSNWTILIAAAIFGASHLDNGPGPLPNWPYALLATIAGFAFGKVFARSSSVLSSAMLHALVDTTKHVFF